MAETKAEAEMRQVENVHSTQTFLKEHCMGQTQGWHMTHGAYCNGKPLWPHPPVLFVPLLRLAGMVVCMLPFLSLPLPSIQ